MDRNDLKQLLLAMCKDCDCHRGHDPYCTLIEIVLSANTANPRFLVQAKCVEKYRYIIDKEEGVDLKWNDAYMRWADEGFAKKFAEHYREDISFEDLFKLIYEERNRSKGK